MRRAEIRIGTSGWQYRHWVGRFYPQHSSGAKMFAHYLAHFDSVEINNSFYRMPSPQVFARWCQAAPHDFCFATKASRFITHNKKLKDCELPVSNFLTRAEELGEKLGPILFQLPPHWQVNLERLEDFLRLLPRYHRYAFEFRHASWMTAQTFTLLRRYNAAHCIYHLAGYLSPMEITADWTYVRLHGPAGKYQGSYSADELAEWAKRIEQWSTELKSVYLYFDNDQAAYAAQNALELKSLVQHQISSTKAAPRHRAA